jgi:antitoxin ParD1/3/4
MPHTDLSLPPELAAFVSGQVASGGFASETEVIHAALWLMRDRQRVRELRIAELREELQPAIEELARGEGVPLDMEDIKRRGRERMARRGQVPPCPG